LFAHTPVSETFMGDIRSRLASFWLSTSLLLVVGLVAGCGDNTPGKTGTGGAGGGTGGTAGAAGAAGAGGEAGMGGLAGSDAGAAGAGGMPDAGTDAAVPCYGTTFTAPSANNAMLTVTDDTDHTCADGFQYIVTINSDAPDGTQVTLSDGNTVLKSASVSGHKASFDVQLSTGGTAQALSIQYPSTALCNVVTNVTVSCDANAPTCSISKPEITATHPALNGVAAPDGDRVSSTGSAYQVTFTVKTSAEDGQPISLAVDNAASPAAITNFNATASGGTATFNVPLVPDGTYEVVATCNNKNGIKGTSAKAMFPVDTTPPDLTLTKPSSGMFVVGATIDVCGQTTQSDAANLASSLGSAQDNLCVFVGSSANPKCGAMAAVNAPSCVTIDCPGASAFDLKVRLKDAAGNPTFQTLTGVTCASSHPTVQIIAPASDAPAFTDKTKHILSATAPTGNKDLDPATPGAQVDVVACTDTPGTAVLTAGHAGDTSLTQVGGTVTTVAATTADNCPASLPNVARFSGVTLPESNQNADGTLAAATRLVVTVTSSANTANIGVSQPDDVWVDTIPPNLALVSPANLCGQFIQSSTTVSEDLVYSADYKTVVVDVTNGATTTTYDTPAFMNGTATFTVTFSDGLNTVTATETDPAGNATVLAPCNITLGMAPVVTFTTPTSGAILCPTGATSTACIDDNDTNTPGWQGSVAVTVTVAGQPVTTGDAVTFTINGNSIGGANLDASGHAQLNAITIPDGVQTIVATTGDISGAGVGTGSVTVTVDTMPPNAPTGLTALVKDRRQTSVQLTWTAPSDANGANVAGYLVRWAKSPINATNFDTSKGVTKDVPYTGAPATGGQLDGILVSNLDIETGYYFAVEAVDVAGTTSAPIVTSSELRPHFQTTILNGTGTDGIGQDVDGSGDFGTAGSLGFVPDGLSDLIVGGTGGKKVYIYFGTTSGYSTTPSITITGSTTNFGQAVVNAGDLDGDGKADIAIASPNEGAGGKVYVFSRLNPPASWGTTNSWPATLTDAQANYVITADATLGGPGSIQPQGLARLGNFDGMGADDLAIGFAVANGFNGSVVIVRGSTSFASMTISDAASANAIVINGTDPGGFLGVLSMGIGNFFPGAGPTLVTSAAGASALYAFGGRAPSAALTPADANASVVGPAADLYGLSLGFLGPLGNSPGAIAIGAPAAGPAYVDVDFGVSEPFGAVAPGKHVRLRDSASGNSFGVVNIGSGIKGTSQALSLIGSDALPDLVVAGQAEAGLPVYVVSGAVLPTLSGTVDVATVVNPATGPASVVKIPNGIPSTGWGGYAGGSIIFDANGDGAPDFAVGEFAFGKPGRVVVFY
jgi:hypothetical protein